jgi:hypothetical protein
VDGDLERLAELLRRRDDMDEQIAAVTGRSARPGDIGEYIASVVFDIELAATAVQAGYDGRFRSGPFAGRTVNIKAYGDISAGIDIGSHPCDYYLVISGPRRATGRVQHHRWQIARVCLFEAARLLSTFADRKVQIGVATSLRQADLTAAEIYPTVGADQLLVPTEAQRHQLDLFAQHAGPPAS